MGRRAASSPLRCCRPPSPSSILTLVYRIAMYCEGCMDHHSCRGCLLLSMHGIFRSGLLLQLYVHSSTAALWCNSFISPHSDAKEMASWGTLEQGGWREEGGHGTAKVQVRCWLQLWVALAKMTTYSLVLLYSSSQGIEHNNPNPSPPTALSLPSSNSSTFGSLKPFLLFKYLNLVHHFGLFSMDTHTH
jgi:hypothetical protein